MSRPRPLQALRSIKLKWSIVIVGAVAITAASSQVGVYLGWPVWLRPIIAATLALGFVQFLAHGMTYPIRQMSRAAGRMSHGDYRVRVDESANDEIGELARAFNRMAADLAEVDRTQKEFIANASHELRTPIAALRSTLENLVDGIGRADHRTLTVMLAQAEHLGRLVEQLLDLSRLDAGTDLRRVPVDIGDLLHDVAGEQRLTQPTALIEVKAPVDLRVEADPQRLRQVFSNVIGNAVRFSPIGAAVTVVASKNGSADGPLVRVAVRDHGPGIVPENRKRVFERFWQADGSGPTGAGGAGLGLAISKRIVDQHSGTIEITPNTNGSAEGAGTCVVISLPRMVNRAQPAPTRP